MLNKHKIPQKYRKDFFLQDLIGICRYLSKITLTINDYKKYGNYDVKALIRYFGSWNTAVARAGILVNTPNFILSSNLMENIKNVWDKLGRQPKSLDMVKPFSRYNLHTYYNRYGSWKNVIIAFKNYIITSADGSKYYNEIGQSQTKKSRKRRAISLGLRYDVFKRDNFTCVKCGRNTKKDPLVVLHVDHKIPVSKGGKSTIDDLQTLCDWCNLGKGTKDD